MLTVIARESEFMLAGMEPMTLLRRIQEWYTSQCDGEWEHRYGIVIESCDNPGWWVKIDLHGTDLVGRSFDPIAKNIDSDGCQTSSRWLHCYIKHGVWNGAGDETKLETILQHFLAWVSDDS